MQAAERHVGECRQLLMLQLETQLLDVKPDGAAYVGDLIADAVKFSLVQHINSSELVADANLETPWHDEAAVRRQDRPWIALGQRILVRDVVADELHDEPLVELQDDPEIELLVALQDIDVLRLT